MRTIAARSPAFLLVVSVLVLVVLVLVAVVLVRVGMAGSPAWPWDMRPDGTATVLGGVRDLGGLVGPALGILLALLSLALAWNFERLRVVRDRMALARTEGDRPLRREWRRSLRGPATLVVLGIAALAAGVAAAGLGLAEAHLALRRSGGDVTPEAMERALGVAIRAVPLAAFLGAVGIVGGWAALARVHRAALASAPPEPPPVPPGARGGGA